jgi:hypothetical protein
MSVSPSKQPWPMKWVVIAIILFVVPYTFLRLYFRKPERAFRPYEDTKNRVVTNRLLSSGYQRVALEAQRPADPAKLNVVAFGGRASPAPAPGGLPASLRSALIDTPLLPVSIDEANAAAEAVAGQPYPIQFTCTIADHKTLLEGAHLYRRDGELVIVPTFEKLNGNLLTRTTDSAVLITLPGSTLKPGRYEVTVVGARASRRWVLQVH